MKNYFNNEVVKKALANRKVRKTVVLLVGFVIFLLLLWFIGLFGAPAHYRVVESPTDGQLSQYLTNYILPQLHNKSQYGQPFEVVFSEHGVNDVIARHIDVNSLQKAGLSDLSVAFKKGKIFFVGKTVYHGFDFCTTVVLKSRINKEGRFFLEVSKVQIGDSRVPFIGEIVKKKTFRSLANLLNSSKGSDFIRALFNNSKAEPIFSINHNKVKIEGITVREDELTARFIPQED